MMIVHNKIIVLNYLITLKFWKPNLFKTNFFTSFLDLHWSNFLLTKKVLFYQKKSFKFI